MGSTKGTPPTTRYASAEPRREARVTVSVLSDTIRVPSEMEPSTPSAVQQKHTWLRELRAS